LALFIGPEHCGRRHLVVLVIAAGALKSLDESIQKAGWLRHRQVLFRLHKATSI